MLKTPRWLGDKHGTRAPHHVTVFYGMEYGVWQRTSHYPVQPGSGGPKKLHRPHCPVISSYLASIQKHIVIDETDGPM